MKIAPAFFIFVTKFSTLLTINCKCSGAIKFTKSIDSSIISKSIIEPKSVQDAAAILDRGSSLRNFSIENSGGNNIGYIESPTNETLINMNLSSDEQYLFPYANLMVSIDFLGEVLSGMKPDEDGTIKLLDYLENINEVGLGLGVGVNFGFTGNQIDFGYKFSKRSGLHLIDKETLHTFNVGVSIGDLWFVKRREI